MRVGLTICGMLLLSGCAASVARHSVVDDRQTVAVSASSAAMTGTVGAIRPEPGRPQAPLTVPDGEPRNDGLPPATAALVAPQSVDKSAANIPPELLRDAIIAFDALTDAPQSVRLRRMRVVSVAGGAYESLCGEFSLTNGTGTRQGFEAFHYLPPYRYVSTVAATCQEGVTESTIPADSSIQQQSIAAPTN